VLALPSETAKIEEFRRRVIEWYEAYGDKHLPWRSAKSGWAVLIAPFLLRKTTVAQVLKVYEEFLKRFPGPRSLLSAGENEVKELIRPLGIEHQRSKHLIELAEVVVKRFGGQVPCSKEKLMELPGVGDYTASEVLLVACRQPEPLLDRNMIRIIERVFSVKSVKKRPHTDRLMWSFAKILVPKDPEEAKKFNFGVLDLARKVCTAGNPHCSLCPVKSLCSWFARSGKGQQASIDPSPHLQQNPSA
jgi:A/G-specific adenine glycosylase